MLAIQGFILQFCEAFYFSLFCNDFISYSADIEAVAYGAKAFLWLRRLQTCIVNFLDIELEVRYQKIENFLSLEKQYMAISQTPIFYHFELLQPYDVFKMCVCMKLLWQF